MLNDLHNNNGDYNRPPKALNGPHLGDIHFVQGAEPVTPKNTIRGMGTLTLVANILSMGPGSLVKPSVIALKK